MKINIHFLRCCCLGLAVVSAEAASPKIVCLPSQPKGGETVTISIQPAAGPSVGSLLLEYQLVDPGAYIDLRDPAFKSNWTTMPMNDDGLLGDRVKGDGIHTVQLEPRFQVHRRVVRYRVVTGRGVIAPAETAVPNFAYFVYDGVPAWTGAIDPTGNGPEARERITFATNVMRRLPVYHLISKRKSVENTTWYEQAAWDDEEARSRYNYTGTFVDDQGVVYDHVRFRARGGQWRYAMGKNMWKFDFNRGHHLQARDNYGQPYRTKWEKLNLGACIQQGSSLHRGEHGMFEAVGFKLFNLAGVEGPHTHWIHFRIVDEAEETTSDQFGGDFWGLYLVTEDMEDDFLKEHDLPPGNLYKMEFGDPVLQTKSSHARSGDPDVRLFLGGYRTNRAEKWWQENVDLPRYYSYRSIVECIHHYDIYAGKNYFYYHHPVTGQWSVHPWDIDLTWADNMHGSGEEPFFRAGLLRRSPFDRGYQNRLREIRDLLFNPEQTGALIAAYAALISSPELEDSFVEADRRRWDYHPIMASRYVHPRKAGQGLFYAITPQKSFSGMLELMNRYVRRRGAWVDAALLRGSVVPPQPRVERNDSLSGAAAGVGFRATLPEGSKPTPTYQWRLGQTSVTQPHLKETQFEIVALWQTNSGAQVRIPRDLIRAGETYRVRARAQDASGYCGPWSEAVEVTGGK